MGGKFKFQVQDSDLGYFFLRFDKNLTLSEKKLPLARLAIFFGVLDKLGTIVGFEIQNSCK